MWFSIYGLCNRANEKCNDYGTYYVCQTQMLYEGKSSVGRKLRIGANLENAGSDKGIDSISVWAQEADKNGVYAGTVDASNWCHVIGHCIETIFVDRRNFEHDARRLNLSRGTWAKSQFGDISMSATSAAIYVDQVMLPRLLESLQAKDYMKDLISTWPKLATHDMSAITNSAPNNGETRRVIVDSGNLHSVGYDLMSQALEIEFNSGRIYHYYDVPEEMYEQLINAPSHGKFFALYIRNVYPYQQVH